nr:hypothetical protein [Candidatus Anoxychlamydiales bacterium]
SNFLFSNLWISFISKTLNIVSLNYIIMENRVFVNNIPRKMMLNQRIILKIFASPWELGCYRNGGGETHSELLIGQKLIRI